ncbi:hypothetical protein HRbin36_01565 [bacterium HR36]|nr:hypothetical protein HRbin36_01565 [bacterium HR36]
MDIAQSALDGQAGSTIATTDEPHVRRAREEQNPISDAELHLQRILTGRGHFEENAIVVRRRENQGSILIGGLGRRRNRIDGCLIGGQTDGDSHSFRITLRPTTASVPLVIDREREGGDAGKIRSRRVIQPSAQRCIQIAQRPGTGNAARPIARYRQRTGGCQRQGAIGHGQSEANGVTARIHVGRRKGVGITAREG